jgi:type IV pilus assembly protein PilA
MIKRIKGFTLIELMIVVAIVGTMAAFAIPAYQTYIIRTQVTEGITLSEGAKVAVTEYYLESGDWPNIAVLQGLYELPVISGTYTKQVKISDNVIQITYAADAHPAIANAQVDLVASDNNGSVSWTCTGSKTILSKHLPSVCR